MLSAAPIHPSEKAAFILPVLSTNRLQLGEKQLVRVLQDHLHKIHISWRGYYLFEWGWLWFSHTSPFSLDLRQETFTFNTCLVCFLMLKCRVSVFFVTLCVLIHLFQRNVSYKSLLLKRFIWNAADFLCECRMLPSPSSTSCLYLYNIFVPLAC